MDLFSIIYLVRRFESHAPAEAFILHDEVKAEEKLSKCHNEWKS